MELFYFKNILMLKNLNIKSDFQIKLEIFENTATKVTFCKIFCRCRVKVKKRIPCMDARNSELFQEFDVNRNSSLFMSNLLPKEYLLFIMYINTNYN